MRFTAMLMSCALALPGLGLSGLAQAATPSYMKGVCNSEDLPTNLTVNTRYGAVKYLRYGILVDGKRIPDEENVPGDIVVFMQLYRLGDEDVLLSEGIPTGSAVAPTPADFLLVLARGKPPHIVLLPDDSACTARQRGDELHMAGGQDLCGNALPVVVYAHGKLTGAHAPQPTCFRRPEVVSEKDCRHEYTLSSEHCAFGPRNQCAQDANALLVGANGPLSEAWDFIDMPKSHYFNMRAFNDMCRDWCEGRKVSYERYKKAVCLVR